MTFAVARKRMERDGDAAAAELLASQRGLVVSVERRYRRLIAAETATIDREDLVQVGLERLLEVAITRYAVPASQRPDGAAWSKVVLRRDLERHQDGDRHGHRRVRRVPPAPPWMRSLPTDRHAASVDVAHRMACAAA